MDTTVNVIGLDIAKNVFVAVGQDARGKVVWKRTLSRQEVLPTFAAMTATAIGIEACATSHYWSRELQACGHTVKLMPPAYVKPYVKRQKNDAAMPRRFAKRFSGRTCGLCQRRRLSSSLVSCSTGRAIS